MGFDDVFHDAESESGAAAGSASAFINSIETFEEAVDVFGGDANAGIGDVEPRGSVFLFEADFDSAFGGVFDRIFDQVHDDLGDLVGVGFDLEILGTAVGEGKVFCFCSWKKHVEAILNDFAEVARGFSDQV